MHGPFWHAFCFVFCMAACICWCLGCPVPYFPLERAFLFVPISVCLLAWFSVASPFFYPAIIFFVLWCVYQGMAYYELGIRNAYPDTTQNFKHARLHLENYYRTRSLPSSQIGRTRIKLSNWQGSGLFLSFFLFYRYFLSFFLSYLVLSHSVVLIHGSRSCSCSYSCLALTPTLTLGLRLVLTLTLTPLTP
jgi:hypothetical protein